MRYLITRSTFGTHGKVELTREEFDLIRTAKQGVLLALAVEERFAILRENYREYEREIFEIAQREVIYAQHEWSERIDDIYAVNRRLLNLLAAARLYRDQLNTELSAAQFVDPAIRHDIRILRDAEADNSWSFEFMESIRDTIQHKIFPVDRGGRKSSVEHRSESQRMLRHTATPQISLTRLRERGHITRQLFDRVRPRAEKGDAIQLNAVVREYMLVIGKIHKGVRERMAESVAGWDDIYLRAIQRGIEATGDRYALSLCCEYEDTDDELAMEKPPKDEDLLDDLVRRRQYLERRASRAHMMPDARDYISTE